jgi:MOSC domain-containing protein YiiM
VPKHPVMEGTVTRDGIIGDRQRSLKVHGGPDRAICLFSLERIEALEEEGHPIRPGSAGENLTIAGLDWEKLKPGDRLHVGPYVELEVTSYTTPCELNARWFREGDYKRISQKKHPGWSRLYARVLREGVVRPGDLVRISGAEKLSAVSDQLRVKS